MQAVWRASNAHPWGIGGRMRLKEQLRGIIPDEKLEHLSNHFHIIGDTAIISISPELGSYKEDISWAIVSKNRNIKTVLNKVSKVDGDRRVAKLEMLGRTKDTYNS